MAAPCARLQLVRGPVRIGGVVRPLNWVVRHHVKQRELAIMVIVLAIYLLVHAAMNGWGAYMLWELDRTPSQSPLQYPTMEQVQEAYDSLRLGLVIFGLFGVVTLVAGVGLVRGLPWSRPLWLGVSMLLIGCISYSVFGLGASWDRYLFEAVAVLISWWYMAIPVRESRDA